MDDKIQNGNTSGLSNEEEKLFSGDSIHFDIPESIPEEEINAEEIRIERPGDGVPVKSPPENIESKQTGIQASRISTNVEDKAVVSQRFSQERYNGVFYTFLGTAVVFYALSIWIIMASLSICSLPESFRRIVLSFGKILS